MSHWVRLTFSRLFNLVPRGKALWTRLPTFRFWFYFPLAKICVVCRHPDNNYGCWSSRQRLFGRHCQGSSGRSTLAVSRGQVWRAGIRLGELKTSYPSPLPRACSLGALLISSAIARNPALISWGFLGGKAERAVNSVLIWYIDPLAMHGVSGSWRNPHNDQNYDFSCLWSLRKALNHVSDRDCSKTVLKLRLRAVSLY